MSLTSRERQALQWVLAVAVLGAGVKVAAQWRHAADATPAGGEALARQLLAVDSAQRAGRQGGAAAAKGRRVRSVRARPSAAVPSDSGRAPRRRASRDMGVASGVMHLPILEAVDVDRADSLALDRLPGIGPTLAVRIVADRNAHGAFGSLEALQRVRGIGPKLAAGLAGLVTFSANPRPSAVRH